MIIRTLRLVNFRGHAETQVSFTHKANLFYGPNGAGKTNIIEAVHYLCLSKSFLVAQDAYALRRGAPYFEIEGTFEGDRRPSLKVRLVFLPQEGKKLFVNRAPLTRLSEIVGKIPVVVFSPSDYALTAGGPDERRRFLNNIICQARPVYLDDLMNYRRVLRQRNELLSQKRRTGKPFSSKLMESWNAELVKLGSRVIVHRQGFVAEFSDFLDQAYQHVAAISEEPSMAYAGIASLSNEDNVSTVEEKFWRKLQHVQKREYERGVSLVGPHRDEIVLKLNDMDVRRYASQGQHRTLGMALKLANYFYLQEKLEEHPILLLDDVFDHLDEFRSGAFLELIKTRTVQQSIMTAAKRTAFDGVLPFKAPEHQCLRVVAGQLEAEGELS